MPGEQSTRLMLLALCSISQRAAEKETLQERPIRLVCVSTLCVFERSITLA